MLNIALAALHRERERTWDPAVLKLNIDQRGALVKAAEHTRFVQTGDAVPEFALTEASGERLTLSNLLETGPALLVFFRFAGCPACNIALPYYEREVAPHLAAHGVSLTAISPQPHNRLAEIKQRHTLTLNVASDNYELARGFGLLFEPDAPSQAAMRARGTTLGELTGTGSWELPYPAAILIGQDRVVHFADVSPDWLIRTEASRILAATHSLLRVRAAA